MATIAAQPHQSIPKLSVLPGRRYDHYFFSFTALLMLVTVLLGFARTYYLAGIFRAPLPSLVIHIHGAAFTVWILLLVTQTSLVAAGRTDIHRKLGIAGFLVGCLMIILGVMASTDSLVRHAGQVGPSGLDAGTFYIIPLSDILLFAVFLFLAFRNRRDSPAHKRYIYLATTALLLAAFARWPFAFIAGHFPVAVLSCEIYLLFLIAYDLWSTHKIHRATLWAGAFLIFVQQVRIPLAKTGLWHSFADWVILHAR